VDTGSREENASEIERNRERPLQRRSPGEISGASFLSAILFVSERAPQVRVRIRIMKLS
jgi:hypothetical protein